MEDLGAAGGVVGHPDEQSRPPVPQARGTRRVHGQDRQEVVRLVDVQKKLAGLADRQREALRDVLAVVEAHAHADVDDAVVGMPEVVDDDTVDVMARSR
jgi:hypothetical protein